MLSYVRPICAAVFASLALMDTLSDFLLFSSQTYWRLFARMNAELWPLHIQIAVVTVGLAVSVTRGRRKAGLVVGIGIAAAWALVAQVFFSRYYVNFNWAVASIIPIDLPPETSLVVM